MNKYRLSKKYDIIKTIPKENLENLINFNCNNLFLNIKSAMIDNAVDNNIKILEYANSFSEPGINSI